MISISDSVRWRLRSLVEVRAIRRGSLEGIEARDKKIDPFDPMRAHRFSVIQHVAPGEETAVDFGMQSLHAPVHDLRKFSDFGDVGHGQARIPQNFRCAARRNQRHVALCQGACESREACLVKWGQQRAADRTQGHATVLLSENPKKKCQNDTDHKASDNRTVCVHARSLDPDVARQVSVAQTPGPGPQHGRRNKHCSDDHQGPSSGIHPWTERLQMRFIDPRKGPAMIRRSIRFPLASCPCGGMVDAADSKAET